MNTRRKIEQSVAGAALATLKVIESKDPFGTLAGMLENAAKDTTTIDTTAVEIYSIEPDGPGTFKVLDGADNTLSRGLTKQEARDLVKRLKGVV